MYLNMIMNDFNEGFKLNETILTANSDLNDRYQKAKEAYVLSGATLAAPINTSEPIGHQLRSAQALGKQWNVILNINPD